MIPRVFVILLVVLSACSSPATADPVPESPRVVALGDLHGDLAATRRALTLAGVLGADGHWAGGATRLVQVGDQLDRGDDEQAILDLLERLTGEAKAAGGAVRVLLGNHEVMNAALDLRYVTPGGWADFADTPYDPTDPLLSQLPPDKRGRVAAFRPGGPYARLLAGHSIAVVVEGTVFVHGGLLPQHVAYGIDRLNAEAAAWLRGEAPMPEVLQGADSPIWDRSLSTDPAACADLERSLELLGARRMVVGHTVQRQGINAACDGKVWRVDVGMSAHYGGRPQALEIVGDQVRVLSESGAP